MNFPDLQQWLARRGGLSGLRTHPLRSQWLKIRNAIAPHYFGEMPPSLVASFPNEDSTVLAYRKTIYQPITQAALLEAMDEIYRLFTNSKYNIEPENEDFKKWLETARFDNMALPNWIFQVAYASRVIDPNAYLLVMPRGEGLTDATQRVEPDLHIISSDTIVNFYDEEGGVFVYAELPIDADSDGRLSTMRVGEKSRYWFVTDEIYAYAEYSTSANEWELHFHYAHNLKRAPVSRLGGRTVFMRDAKMRMREVQYSDFSAALPLMEDAALYDNQDKSVTLSTAFPFKFVQGAKCDPCSGSGKLTEQKADGLFVSKVCGTCKGSGQVFPTSPLAGYYMVPPPEGISPEERAEWLKRRPLEFVSPPVDVIVHLSQKAAGKLAALHQALSLRRPMNYAQSADSKEIDRESLYVRIGRIAEYMYGILLADALEFAQGLLIVNEQARGRLLVQAPVSFDIKDETELIAEFMAAQQGAPPALRLPAYLDYIGRRFSTNVRLLRVAKMCAYYTPLFLMTPDEQRSAVAAGIPKTELIKATYCFNLLVKLTLNPDFDKWDDARLLDELDAAMQVPLNALNALTAPVGSLADRVAQTVADDAQPG